MAAIGLRSVCKSHGASPVLRDIDLDIADGECVVILGPSGSGKSTLLRLLAGLDDVSAGEILFDGQPAAGLTPARRGVAMVFQSFALYPHMTVRQNLAFPLIMGRVPEAERDNAVWQTAVRLRLEPLLDRRPAGLSGGQKQRVAIGRALVRQPRVLLLDEPFSNLDASLRFRMRQELAELQRQFGFTVVHVTHDQHEAMALADRVVLMRDGRIEQVGAPLALYHQPRNLFAARFIGTPEVNVLDAVLEHVEMDRAIVRFVDGQRLAVRVDARRSTVGSLVKVTVRPEQLGSATAHPGGVLLRGTVVLLEHLGDTTLLHLALANLKGTVIARVPDAPSLNRGQPYALSMAGGDCRLFATDGDAFPGPAVRESGVGVVVPLNRAAADRRV